MPPVPDSVGLLEIVLATSFALTVLWSLTRQPHSLGKASAAATMFAVALAIGGVEALAQDASLLTVGRALLPFVFLLAAIPAYKLERRNRIGRAVLWATAIGGAITSASILLTGANYDVYVPNAQGIFARVTGVDFRAVGPAPLMSILAALALLLAERRGRAAVLLGILVLSLSALLLSQTRSQLLSLVVGLAVLALTLVVNRQRAALKRLALAALLGVAAILVLNAAAQGALLGGMWQRVIAEVEGVDAGARGFEVEVALQAFTDSPLTGTGLGVLRDVGYITDVAYLHDVVLYFLTTTGLIGLGPYVALVTITALRLFRGPVRHDRPANSATNDAGILAVFAALTALSLAFAVVRLIPFDLFMGAACGIAAAGTHRRVTERGEVQPQRANLRGRSDEI